MKLFQVESTLDPDAADALIELGNVGAGKALRALDGLLKVRVRLQTPRIIPLYGDLDALDDAEADNVMVGILMSLTKTLEGFMLVLVDISCVTALVENLTGECFTGEEMLENEDALSAVQEIANQMASAYTAAIGAYTGLRIYLTPMLVGVDMAGALIACPMAELAMRGGKAVCIDSAFSLSVRGGECQTYKGRILILPDESAVGRLLDALSGEEAQ